MWTEAGQPWPRSPSKLVGKTGPRTFASPIWTRSLPGLGSRVLVVGQGRSLLVSQPLGRSVDAPRAPRTRIPRATGDGSRRRRSRGDVRSFWHAIATRRRVRGSLEGQGAAAGRVTTINTGWMVE